MAPASCVNRPLLLSVLPGGAGVFRWADLDYRSGGATPRRILRRNSVQASSITSIKRREFRDGSLELGGNGLPAVDKSGDGQPVVGDVEEDRPSASQGTNLPSAFYNSTPVANVG